MRRRGAEVLEFAVAIIVMFGMFVVCMEIFLLYSQMIVAQNALSQTAMRVAATGSWSRGMQTRCQDLLPGETAAGARNCTLFRANGTRIDPTTTAQVIAADNTALVGAEGTPVRLEISYTQKVISVCLGGVCFPPNLSPQIVRQIDFYTQARRQPGFRGDDND